MAVTFSKAHVPVGSDFRTVTVFVDGQEVGALERHLFGGWGYESSTALEELGVEVGECRLADAKRQVREKLAQVMQPKAQESDEGLPWWAVETRKEEERHAREMGFEPTPFFGEPF